MADGPMAGDLRPPPHLCSEAAERLLLADVLRCPEALDAALARVSADDFFTPRHALVFRVCEDLYVGSRAGGPADVYAELQRRGHLGELGPGAAAWLAELWDAAGVGANVDHHAAQLREVALRRRLWHAARQVLRDASAPPRGTAEEQAAAAAGAFQDLLDAAAGRSGSVADLEGLLRETLGAVEERAARPDRPPGVLSGFPQLDAVTGGFRPGQLVVIAARPSVGKSALLLAVASAVARNQCPAFLASLEMPRAEVGERLLAMGTGVPLQNIRSGRLSDPELTRLAGATAAYQRARLFVDDTPSVTAARFGATVRTLARRHGVGLAAVDYLQLVEPADRREPRVQQVGRVCRELKLVARQCGLPVLAPCQFNRASEDRADGRPRLSDLRESGDIEQTADVVIGLHAPDQDADADAQAVTAIVMKNRNGPRNVEVTLRYRRRLTLFEGAPVGL